MMEKIVQKIAKYFSKTTTIQFSLGFVYLWFGALKFFSHLSPAEDLAKNTIDQLTLGYIPSEISIILLAIWETGLGILLIGNVLRKFTLILAIIHILFTFSPFFFFPELVLNHAPFGLTLLGQYIIKNVVLLGALVLLLNKTLKRQSKQLH